VEWLIFDLIPKNRSMKKVFALSTLLFAVGVFFTGCKKETDSSAGQTANIVFQLAQRGGLKSTLDTILCAPFKANYLKVWLDGNTNPTKINVFYTPKNGDTTICSQSIQLTTGPHYITKFMLFYDNNTPNFEADDVPLSATPTYNSVYAQYVTHPLPWGFNVVLNNTNQATPVPIEVLCYKPQLAANYGSVYFDITEVIVREMNFAGILAITKKSDYAQSPYSQQVNWSQATGEFYNAAAISKIEVWRKELPETVFTLKGTFMNTSQGEPIKVNYVDVKGKSDIFEFRLHVLVKAGTTYYYKWISTWSFWDDIPFGNVNGKPYEMVGPNGGKTVTYTVGNCTAPNGNYVFPHYQNLPYSGTLSIWEPWGPGSLNSYFNAALSNISPGFDLTNLIYPGYTASQLYPPTTGQSVGVSIYSSLTPEVLSQPYNTTQWPKVNWLINHIGLAGTNNQFPGYLWSDLQGAIWLLQPTPWNGVATAGVPNQTPMMSAMAAAANSGYLGYTVPTGGWTCVITIPNIGAPAIKLLFVKE